MATLRVSNVEALNITQKTGSGIITMQTGTGIATQTPQAFTSPGQIVQARYFRTDVRANYTASNSGDGNRITDINLTITPKFATSLLLMQWMINGEVNHNVVFVVHRDNSLVTTSGITGYNSQGGNSRWSGLVSAYYDNNDDSTPSNWFIQYAAPATTISPTVFSVAVRSSDGTDRTFSLNRTNASTGSDSYEATVSTGTIWEIAQ